MRSYGLSMALGFAAMLAVVVASNFVIDMNGVYRRHDKAMAQAASDYVAKLRASAQGLLFAAPERSVKIELARQGTADCAVIGSSRAMQFDRETAPNLFRDCHDVENLTVSSGAFEDLVGMAGVLADRAAPRTIFIDVSPWLLRRNADTRWMEHQQDYEHGREITGLAAQRASGPAIDAKWLNLISGDYAIYNLRSAFWMLRHQGDVPTQAALVAHDARDARPGDAVTMPDGRHVYPRSTTATLIGAAGSEVYKIEQPTMDPIVVAEFAKLVRFLQRDSKVVLLLAPYRPNVMNCMTPNVCDALARVETCTRALAPRLSVDVIGSYDPRPLGLDMSDFIDELHLNMQGLRKMTRVDHNPWPARGMGADAKETAVCAGTASKGKDS
jgi:hypothetical protein